jgi:hypothetical protein
MRLSAPRWGKQPLDGSRARTSRPPAPRGDAREASSIQASPMPRCVVDLELVAFVALRRGSLWCWCPTRVDSRESECRRSCQASSTREPRRHLLSPAAISVDGCGSGGEFAQDCVDGNGGGAFRASAASWRFVRRRAVRRGRRKARRPRRCRETRSPAERRRSKEAAHQGGDGHVSSCGRPLAVLHAGNSRSSYGRRRCLSRSWG